MPLKLQNAYGYAGATDALHNLIARQKAAEIAEAMAAYKAEQDAIKNSFEHRRVSTDEGRLGLDTSKHGQDVREYDEAAPKRVADVAHTQAQTGELLRKPEAERVGREHDMNKLGAGAMYRLGEINAEEGRSGRLMGMENLFTRGNIRLRADLDQRNDAAKATQAAGGELSPQELDQWAERLVENPDEFAKLDQKTRTALSRHMALSANTPDSPLRKKAEAMQAEALGAIQKLRTMSGKSGAIGMPSLFDPGSLTRPFTGTSMPGSAPASYAEQVKRVQSALTLPRLRLMQGTGPLSNADILLLAKSATSLSSVQNEAEFDAELDRLEQELKRGGTAAAGGEGMSRTAPAQAGGAQRLVYDPATGTFKPKGGG